MKRSKVVWPRCLSDPFLSFLLCFNMVCCHISVVWVPFRTCFCCVSDLVLSCFACVRCVWFFRFLYQLADGGVVEAGSSSYFDVMLGAINKYSLSFVAAEKGTSSSRAQPSSPSTTSGQGDWPGWGTGGKEEGCSRMKTG